MQVISKKWEGIIVISKKADAGDNGLHLLGRVLIISSFLYLLTLNPFKWILEIGCGKGNKRIYNWGVWGMVREDSEEVSSMCY